MRTGESTCKDCGQRVLLAVKAGTDTIVALEPDMSDGGWSPWATPVSNVIRAKYVAPDQEQRERRGHHGHALRCPVVRAASMEDSRRRIADATTERGTQMIGEAVLLPVVRPRSVRAFVGSLA